MKKLMLMLAAIFMTVGVAMAQTHVKGDVVSSEDGQPIIGATVMAKGTTVGVSTDIDGKFSLNVPAGVKTLVVSFVGMVSQEVAVKPNLHIVLDSDSQILDDVMVVAFGTTRKEAFTGSAAVVKADDLQKHVATNVQNTLAGSVPGLQLRGGTGAPGSSSGTINIRGISTLYAGNDPLIIVDGAPYPSSLSNIPQDDIESVTVLKDAVSAALYGARGANGVILITTKRGKTKDAQIKVEAKFGGSTRAVQDYDLITDPGEFYEAYYAQIYNLYYYGQGQSASVANKNANARMLSDLHYNVYTLPEGQMLIGENGKLNPNATLGSVYTASDGNQYWLQPDDWRKASFHTAPRQEYTISTNGVMDRGSFYASVSYLNEDGVIDYSDYRRLSARLKADYQARKWLKVGVNVGYTNSKTTSNPNLDTSGSSTNLSFYSTFIPPIFPIYVRTYENGQIAIKKNPLTGNDEYDYGTTGAAYTGVPGLSRPFSQTGNPLGTNRYNKNVSDGQQLNATGTIDIDFTSWLKLNITSNVNWGHSNGMGYDTMFEGPKQGAGGEIRQSQTDNLRTDNTQTLTFYKTFAKKHNVNVLAGHEYYDQKTRYLYAYAQGLFSEDVLELDAAANHSGRSSSYTSRYNNEGFLGQALYNYDEKYYGQFTYRRDASSRFNTNNRWGNFWGAGASWVVSKESFMEGTSSWLDYLKVRYSYGQQGNDGIGNWAYIDQYDLGTSMSPSFSQLGNPNITWETVTKQDVGLEFSLFKGRLSGNVDFYHQKTSDLLFWLSNPESSGSRGYYGNIGDMRNLGIEVALTGTVYRNRNFDISISANIAHNSSKILTLPESKIKQNGGFTWNSYFWVEEGAPLYQGYRKSYAGTDEKGQAMYWVDSSLEGSTSKPGTLKDKKTYNPNEASYYRQGTFTPDLYGGFAINAKLWMFDLTATFDYQIGGKGYDSRYASSMGVQSDSNNSYIYNIHKDWAKSWTPNNTESDIPRWQYLDQYTTANSDRFITDASYLNFQSFQVGFNVPKKWTNSMRIQGLRVYASGENLYYWSARDGFDPRQGYGGNSSVATYPMIRTILGGIQISF